MYETMIKKSLDSIILAYDKIVKGIDSEAHDNDTDRAYGGIVRSGKGGLVESMARALVETAWVYYLGQSRSRLDMDKKKIKVKMKTDYPDKIENDEVKKYLKENRNNQYYRFGTDVHVFIDGKLVLPIECKAYTENAMIKRIIFDANLAYEYMNIGLYILLQLESQLGGDYHELNKITFGSPSTNTLLSYSDVKIEIITLLEGERKVDKPIHKAIYYKPLKYEYLYKAMIRIGNALRKYI